MTTHKTSAEECAQNICGVCSRCGGEITPIETLDNAGCPTFWPGCATCQKFEHGVPAHVYKIAERLVKEEGYRHHHYRPHCPSEIEKQQQHALHSQISHACGVVMSVLRLAEQEGMRETPTVALILSGGLVQEALATARVDVTVVDYDIDGPIEADHRMIEGQRAWVYDLAASADPERVVKIHNEADVPITDTEEA